MLQHNLSRSHRISRQAGHPYTYEFCDGRVPYLDHYNDVWSEKNLTGLHIQNPPMQMDFKARRSDIISHLVEGLLSPCTCQEGKKKEKNVKIFYLSKK